MSTKWGQNFLKDENIAWKIVKKANLKKDEWILEVGPGEGLLTKYLLNSSARVVAVEIDNFLIKKLKEQFSSAIQEGKLILISEDILKINLIELLKNYKIEKYQVVANIPYYITSKIIRLFLEARFLPEAMLLMVQKELAERIVAPVGKTSLLSLAVQYYAYPEILFTVPPQAFKPAPQVESAVIKIITKKEFLNLNDQEFLIKQKASRRFFRLARAGFASRRKTLSNNLSSSFHLEKERIKKILENARLSPNTRAQELSLEEWKNLEKEIEKEVSKF